MDYRTQSLPFKARKAWRYARLYGPSRTLVKIRSQYHMERQDARAWRPNPRPGKNRHVGILGCGKFAYANVAYYLRRAYGDVIRVVMDVNIARAASLGRRYRVDEFTDDPSRVIEDPDVDLVFVTSNHASHAEYAVAALEAGKHVHIEKPHVVTFDQLERLCETMESAPGQVSLGFNRPRSRIGLAIATALARESGPAVFNWFVAGHQIPPDHWYFREEEGGRVLGNLCHWTDFVLQLVPPDIRHPIVIRPTTAAHSDIDLAVTYVFGEGTVAAITFSAKGHTFEGVKERFAAHKGDVLIAMDDFQSLVIERGVEKKAMRLRHRDHGHKDAIERSYAMARPGVARAEPASVRYVWETAELFMRTREALEGDREVTVEAFPGDFRRSPTRG